MSEPGIERSELVAYLDRLLDSPSFSDYGPNGLQVEGRRQVRRVVTGVSACVELFERAAEAGADAVLVHHGTLWKGLPQEVTGVRYQRIKTLIRNDLNLIAYHLPLDAHADLGNNALAARALGCEQLEPFAEFEGRKIGFCGPLAEPIDPDELLDRCTDVFGAQPSAFLSGGDAIETIGIVSGGGSRALYEAIDLGLDAFVTGEPTEWVMNVAKEAGIHFVAAGHYHTEVLGIRALGEHLADHFGIAVEFVDIPNPV